MNIIYNELFNLVQNFYSSDSKTLTGGASIEKTVICFDFDLTLTSIHSHGIPSVEIRLFEDVEEVKKQLALLSTKAILYIVSRGKKEYLDKYLKDVGMSSYFTGIYGSSDEFPIELDKYTWATIKFLFLNDIVKKENIVPEQLYFFDDTIENVIYSGDSKRNPVKFSNTFQVLRPELPLLNLLNSISSYKMGHHIVANTEYNVLGRVDLKTNGDGRGTIMLQPLSTEPSSIKAYILTDGINQFMILKDFILRNNFYVKKLGTTSFVKFPSGPTNNGDIFKLMNN